MQGMKTLPPSLRPVKRPASSVTSEKRVAGNEKRVAGNEKRVAGNEKRVAGNEKRVAGNEKRVAGSEKRVAGNEKRIGSEKPTIRERRPPTSHRVVPAIYRQLFGNDEYEDDGFVVDDIDHSDDMKRLAYHFAARNPAYEHEDEAVESTNDQIAVEEAYSTLQGRKEDQNAIL